MGVIPSRPPRIRGASLRGFGAVLGVVAELAVRHLPVMEHGRLLGIISIGDLVKAIIAQQEFVIGQLENYIAGAIA